MLLLALVGSVLTAAVLLLAEALIPGAIAVLVGLFVLAIAAYRARTANWPTEQTRP